GGVVTRMEGDRVRVSPDRTKMIFHERDCACPLFDLAPLTRKRTLPFETCKLAFLPDGKRVVVVTNDDAALAIRDIDERATPIRVPVTVGAEFTFRDDSAVLAVTTDEGD